MIENLIKAARLLVCSRDPAVLGAVSSFAKASHCHVEKAADVWDAMDRVHSGTALDILVLDNAQDPAGGLEIVHRLREARPDLPLVVLGHSSDLRGRREALRLGVRAYLTKPFKDVHLEVVIQKNLAETFCGVEADGASGDMGDDNFFIGISPMMRELRARVARFAEIDLPVFILGEPGSGKETVARLLHRLSARSGSTFAKVNCAKLPKELIEGEIFGCDGAGDARRTKQGKLGSCNKGTILLDGITEMPLSLQEKLVHVLLDRTFTRNGTSDRIEVDVRIVAASSISLSRAVSEGRLLPRLSIQLSVCPLEVPALRDRKVELPALARHFMHRLAGRYGLSPREIPQAAFQAWQKHEWPGNLVELEKCVKRFLIAGDKELRFEANGFSEKETVRVAAPANSGSENVLPFLPQSLEGIYGYKSLRSLLRSVKEEAERKAIAFALEKTGWNRKAAARLLKTSYRTVLYKIEQYEMRSSSSAQFSQAGNGSGRTRERREESIHAQSENLLQ
jgi:two-component system, NtrC family, response regulator AtoC